MIIPTFSHEQLGRYKGHLLIENWSKRKLRVRKSIFQFEIRQRIGQVIEEGN